MAIVTLHYRDGANYKCQWEADIPDDIVAALPPPGSDGMHDISSLGLSVDDIPLIAEYGFDPEDDHPYVTIEDIVYDD